jgi:DNA-binding response OmpR family regulator
MARILLVDDDPVATTLLTRALEGDGHTVTVSHDGYSAYQEGLATTYDLALVDQILPGMLGSEILTRWRTEDAGPPVIMLSGLTTSDDIVKVLNNGALDFIRKPFHVNEVLARVRVVLARM